MSREWDGDENETHPSLTFNLNDSWITPVSFSFGNASWKYVLLYVLSLILAPTLIITSKILGKPTGFRVKE